MLEYNNITPKKFVVLNGDPYEVLSSHVFRKQQRKPVNQTKLKNLITGKVTEQSFHQSENVEEAVIEKKEVAYLYNNRGEWWFCQNDDRSKRFNTSEGTLGGKGKFLKENSILNAFYFKDKLIGFDIPIKIELRVISAEPAVRGNTLQGATKQVTLEGGAVILAPLFVNEGDIIKVNTETGEYTERVEKK
jgi:elongation factor P